MVIFVCQDNHQPRGQQRTHAFRSDGGGDNARCRQNNDISVTYLIDPFICFVRCVLSAPYERITLL
jgi:hypothetical protein